MNLGQLKTDISIRLGDPDEVRFTDTTLNKIVNMSERKVAEMTKCITTKVTGLTLTADTYLYSIATLLTGYDVLEIQKIFINTTVELDSINEDELKQDDKQNFRAEDSGTPAKWYLTVQDKFGLSPPPDSDSVSNAAAYIAHMPTTALSSDAVAPEVPVMFHSSIIEYAIYLGYLIVKDFKSAAATLGIFNATLQETKRNYKGVAPIDERPLYSVNTSN